MFTKMLGEMMMLKELSNDDKKTHACSIVMGLREVVRATCTNKIKLVVMAHGQQS